MKIKKVLSLSIILLLAGFSGTFVCAQKSPNTKSKQNQAIEIKNQKKLFVDISDAVLKQKLEAFFIKESRFEVVADIKDAEIIYLSWYTVEDRPSFGGIENVRDLPILPPYDSGNSPTNPRTSSQFNNYEKDYRRKTAALVYLVQPNGEKVRAWENQVISINKSTEPGANLLLSQTTKDKMYLAKRFVKDVKAGK